MNKFAITFNNIRQGLTALSSDIYDKVEVAQHGLSELRELAFERGVGLLADYQVQPVYQATNGEYITQDGTPVTIRYGNFDSSLPRSPR